MRHEKLMRVAPMGDPVGMPPEGPRGGVGILRDLRLSTELLILLELCRQPGTKFRAIASDLHMTVQGVSEYIRRMRADGLVERSGARRPTQRGVEFLHRHFKDLKGFVDGASKELNIIETCVAVAKTAVRAGERVGLFMEGGTLTAYSGRGSSSTGIAVNTCDGGEEVAVRELEGIVQLKPGRLYLLQVPPALSGGSRGMRRSALRHFARGPLIVAVRGSEAEVLARRLGLKVDLRFAPVEAAVEACQKGLDVLLIVSSEFFGDVRGRVGRAGIEVSEVRAR